MLGRHEHIYPYLMASVLLHLIESRELKILEIYGQFSHHPRSDVPNKVSEGDIEHFVQVPILEDL